MILLDSGVTHSFISKKVVKELNLPVSTANFAVTLGDERKVRGTRRCQQVELWFQGMSVIQDLFLFDLGSIDVIRGVDWLYKLGEIKINWKRQIMRFNWEGCRMELKGDLSLSRIESTLKALMNSLVEGGEEYLVELGRGLCDEELEKQMVELRLNKLLRKFECLFREPKGLSLKRDQKHAIRLVPNAQPPNIRPY